MKCKKILAALLGLTLAGSSMLPVCAAGERTTPDPNADGVFDILDVISVSKYLHLRGELVKPAEADMDGNGEVDIFDLALILRELVWLNREPLALASKDLTANMQAAPMEYVALDADFSIGQTKFALELLHETAKERVGENVLVSPYSVAQALGMTANGAAGETLSEMEQVLGGSMETLNPAFYTFRDTAQNQECVKLHTANAIWVRDGYPVSSAFLQKNADYYGAGAFEAPFDQSTVGDINEWVNENTDRMIPTLLNEISGNTELILVNAVAFDAKWMLPYDESALSDENFTAADGTEQAAVMMNGSSGIYLSDDHAEGFLQYYNGKRYAFAAILPEEGMTPEAYLDGLTPESLYTMLSEPEHCPVLTKLPEFSYDFSADLEGSLQNMGMVYAFDEEAADFSGMTDVPNHLSIDRVIHKTCIDVTPGGTRAAAATGVLMADNAIPVYEKEISLDRPFVYAIVDTETSVPIFIGTVNSIG